MSVVENVSDSKHQDRVNQTKVKEIVDLRNLNKNNKVVLRNI